MMRLTKISFFGLIAVAVASAGQIRVGEVAGNTSGGANSGLTTAYVSSSASCVGAVYQGNACVGAGTAGVSGSVGTFAKRGYDTMLFSGALLGATAPTPYAGYQKGVAAPADSVLADGLNGQTFAMISDGVVNNNSQNFWQGSTIGSITIPVGVFGVDAVWTMLNNEFGSLGANDTSITFNFGTTSNAITNLTQVSVNLFNSSGNSGGQSAAGGTGQIRSSVDCTTVNSSTCNTISSGPLASSSVLASSVVVNNGAPTARDVNVLTRQIYTSAYDSVVASKYATSTGNVVLDDQGFSFGGAYNGLYLVSVSVTANTATPSTSYSALSALTVDTVPEPSTWLLLATGFGAFGLLGRRRKV